jgi:hypothetical protein
MEEEPGKHTLRRASLLNSLQRFVRVREQCDPALNCCLAQYFHKRSLAAAKGWDSLQAKFVFTGQRNRRLALVCQQCNVPKIPNGPHS